MDTKFAFAFVHSMRFVWVTCTVHETCKYFFFNKNNFKFGFHNTIHTFKNYSVTVFSVFSNKWCTVPRCPNPNWALDLGSIMGPMHGTELPKPKLGLGFRPDSAAPFFKSLFYTALINYKSESRPLTNARRDFPKQRRKTNPTYHELLSSFQETSLYRAYLLELEPSSKATISTFHSHLNIHLEQIKLNL